MERSETMITISKPIESQALDANSSRPLHKVEMCLKGRKEPDTFQKNISGFTWGRLKCSGLDAPAANKPTLRAVTDTRPGDRGGQSLDQNYLEFVQAQAPNASRYPTPSLFLDERRESVSKGFIEQKKSIGRKERKRQRPPASIVSAVADTIISDDLYKTYLYTRTRQVPKQSTTYTIKSGMSLEQASILRAHQYINQHGIPAYMDPVLFTQALTQALFQRYKPTNPWQAPGSTRGSSPGSQEVRTTTSRSSGTTLEIRPFSLSGGVRIHLLEKLERQRSQSTARFNTEAISKVIPTKTGSTHKSNAHSQEVRQEQSKKRKALFLLSCGSSAYTISEDLTVQHKYKRFCAIQDREPRLKDKKLVLPTLTLSNHKCIKRLSNTKVKPVSTDAEISTSSVCMR